MKDLNPLKQIPTWFNRNTFLGSRRPLIQDQNLVTGPRVKLFETAHASLPSDRECLLQNHLMRVMPELISSLQGSNPDNLAAANFDLLNINQLNLATSTSKEIFLEELLHHNYSRLRYHPNLEHIANKSQNSQKSKSIIKCRKRNTHRKKNKRS